MKGINYIVNDKGENISVVIDLNLYQDIWAEFYSKLNTDSRIKKLEKKDFFDFLDQYSYQLDEGYKFNREDIYGR
ncbi:MAG: hypothetical protein HC831_23800 [Chloroflexia bacterium]|nr:hypothetical protein [Chloroflexia bacterium]